MRGSKRASRSASPSCGSARIRLQLGGPGARIPSCRRIPVHGGSCSFHVPLLRQPSASWRLQPWQKRRRRLPMRKRLSGSLLLPRPATSQRPDAAARSRNLLDQRPLPRTRHHRRGRPLRRPRRGHQDDRLSVRGLHRSHHPGQRWPGRRHASQGHRAARPGERNRLRLFQGADAPLHSDLEITATASVNLLRLSLIHI